MKRTWLSTSLTAAGLLLLGAWTTPAHATDVGGTRWTLEGNRSVTIQGLGKDSVAIGYAILTFDGVAADRTGTCSLEVFNDAGDPTANYPCTWKAPRRGNTFSVTLSVPELDADLEADAAVEFGVPVEVTVKSQDNNGVLRQQGSELKLIIRIRGKMQAMGDRQRKVAVVLKGTGVQF